MAKVNGLTKERMLEIENSSITSARIDSFSNLILTTRGGFDINVGQVKGDTGDPGFYVRVITDSVDLNTMKTPGQYLQRVSNNATLVLNYPVVCAGMLEVGQDPIGSFTYQKYHTYGAFNTLYIRTCYDGVWQTWTELSKTSHTHTLDKITDVTATTTEVNSLVGVTSNVQTQINSATTAINGKAPTSHTHTLDKITDVTATTTEVNSLVGVTSNVQTQINSATTAINGKAPTSHTHLANQVTNLLESISTLLFEKYPIAPTSVTWNDVTNAGIYDSIIHGVSNPGGPGGGYYYLVVFSYVGLSKTQVGFPYISTDPIVYRNRYQGSWNPWRKVTAT